MCVNIRTVSHDHVNERPNVTSLCGLQFTEMQNSLIQNETSNYVWHLLRWEHLNSLWYKKRSWIGLSVEENIPPFPRFTAETAWMLITATRNRYMWNIYSMYSTFRTVIEQTKDNIRLRHRWNAGNYETEYKYVKNLTPVQGVHYIRDYEQRKRSTKLNQPSLDRYSNSLHFA